MYDTRPDLARVRCLRFVWRLPEVSRRPSGGRAGRCALAGLLAIVSVGWIGEGRSSAAAPAELISFAPGGSPLVSYDYGPSISGDGNIVVFSSDDFIGNVLQEDVYVRDRVAGTTTHVPATDPPSTRTSGGVLSKDGCHVAFWGLYYFDFPAGEWNIHFWNRCAGTPPVQIAGSLLQPSAFPPDLAISADGRYVVYTATPSSNVPHVGRIDTSTGIETPLTIPFVSTQRVDISDDGKFVAIAGARNVAGAVSNQVLGWTPPCLGTCTIDVISVNNAGQTATGFSSFPAVSADGRFVAFTSDGPELAGFPSTTPDQAYIRDRVNRVTKLVTDTPGQPMPAGLGVTVRDITPDGSQIALTQTSSGETSEVWVARSTSGLYDTAAFDLVSYGVNDQPVPRGANNPSMSSNGRYVAFASSSNPELSGGAVSNASDGEVWLRERPIALDITSTLNFGTVDIGQQSAPQNAVVTNTSGVAINIAGVTPPAAPFAITANSCGGVLPPGASCAITVVFTPTAAGGAASSLTVSGDGLSVSASLVGTGRPSVTDGALKIAPLAVNFGSAPVGTTLPPRNLVVTNTGGTAVTFTGVTLGGSGAGQFAIVSNNCTGALGPGATCTIAVGSTVTLVGAFTANLVVTGAGGQSAQATLRVRGTAVTQVFNPTLKMNPGVVSAGEVTTANGEGFPPGIEVQLAFEGEAPFATVTTDGAGELHVPYLVLRNGIRIGGRQVVVVAPAQFNDVRAPLLIDLATFRPSGFSSPAITSGVRSLVSRNG
jgi:Abnormal spindle-like microcephaly-assoc'd, ASPM-SPD-2-Hydin/WD40-like Beta Propeller Repeat